MLAAAGKRSSCSTSSGSLPGGRRYGAQRDELRGSSQSRASAMREARERRVRTRKTVREVGGSTIECGRAKVVGMLRGRRWSGILIFGIKGGAQSSKAASDQFPTFGAAAKCCDWGTKIVTGLC